MVGFGPARLPRIPGTEGAIAHPTEHAANRRHRVRKRIPGRLARRPRFRRHRRRRLGGRNRAGASRTSRCAFRASLSRLRIAAEDRYGLRSRDCDRGDRASPCAADPSAWWLSVASPRRADAHQHPVSRVPQESCSLDSRRMGLAFQSGLGWGPHKVLLYKDAGEDGPRLWL